MPPSVASAPGSTGKNRPVCLMCSFSCLRVTPACTTASRSCLVHREHLVHLRQVDRHAALHREDVALERGADAVGDHRHAVAAADVDDVAHFFGRLDEDNSIGQARRESRTRPCRGARAPPRRSTPGRRAAPSARRRRDWSNSRALFMRPILVVISPSNGTLTPSDGISSVTFTGNASLPFSLPAAALSAPPARSRAAS